jgi:molecular chaperone DnaK (HSP70)
MVTTVFEGEINSYRLSLSHCIKVIGVKDYCFVSTNNCIAVSYLKDIRKKRDETEIIGIIDFGDRGLTFSICKICSVEVGIVEVLRSEASQIGGNVLNGLLVDDIVEHLLKDKGMDVSKSPKIMHKLKILCAEAKHTLSHS